MAEFLLFLNGRYNSDNLGFYKKLLKGKTTIAVDGGYRFFDKIKKRPDILLGDLDSLNKSKKLLSNKIEIVTYPVKKNKTDLHLALEYCFDQKAKSISIVMPSVGEIDHFLGNILLLFNRSILTKAKTCREISFISHDSYMHFVNNRKLTINKCSGQTVSILPISNSIYLSAKGVEYECGHLKVSRGDSRALRNKIVSDRAVIDIAGQALVIHRFK